MMQVSQDSLYFTMGYNEVMEIIRNRLQSWSITDHITLDPNQLYWEAKEYISQKSRE
jgi:hypothetical protein